MFNRIFCFIISLDIILIDQVSKWFVTERIIRPHLHERFPTSGFQSTEHHDFWSWLFSGMSPPGLLNDPILLPYTEIPIVSFFNIVMVWNRGISFGLFNNHGDYGPLILIGVSVLITIVFSAWLYRTQSRFQSLCIAFIIGGAIGNVIDRIRYGAVIDFLDFHAYGLHYPAFNFADSTIVIGVFMLMFHTMFTAKNL